ncbi:orotidine 5'-phosphate decarboxylase [Phanerochaete sordida]|uniref:Orotidine 5'-phosphate decarboxylase n=1 Tax=Phanerochaete sordida TaxID=48140 RepID=A7M6E5_9APHY|nr:orotidine monophosphate decarboxylase [Phanerochaete sordida]GJE84517.1 orotidine 5'-phosphate decarboxylase [Phanerochaete sordida]
MAHRQTYAQRAAKHPNPAAKALLETIERKKTNLCVSVDVTKSDDFLKVIDLVGPYVCMVKTHVDIIEDFAPTLIERLQELSVNHDFVIFEDRKFADIGNTVALQYAAGVHKIASWAHLTNAHPVPGPGIVSGLAAVGRPLGRGLLLLAEMSTKGSLATGAYTEAAVRMAREHRDFVVGFIAQRRMESVATESVDPEEDFLILTPGVGLDTRGDGMGQQYRTPKEVITEAGCDVIIVGRGIYGKGDNVDVQAVQAQAERYRAEGWAAYLARIQ